MPIYGGQYARTRGDRRLMPDQIAALNERLRFLPEQLAQQQRQEEIRQQAAHQRRQLKLSREQQRFREREAEVGMGLEAAKTGATFQLGSQGRTLGEATKNIFNFGGGEAVEAGTGALASPPTTSGKLFSGLGNLTLGSTIGAGLTGFGVGRFIPKKNKLLRGAAGAAAGGLLGLFTGDAAGGAAKTIGSSVFGGLGGLLG